MRRLLFVTVLCLGCGGPAPLTVDMPLHLEEHLDDATIIGSEVPEDLLQPVEWRFDEPQPGWKATPPRPFPAGIRPAAVSQTDDGLRITLEPSNNATLDGGLNGGVYVDVPEWNHRDWAHVLIRARSSGPGDMALGFNVWDREGHPDEGQPYPYESRPVGNTRLVGDGTVQTYQLPFDHPWRLREWHESIGQLGFWIESVEPVTVEILSITVVPMEAVFADEGAGIRHAERDNRYRRSLLCTRRLRSSTVYGCRKEDVSTQASAPCGLSRPPSFGSR